MLLSLDAHATIDSTRGPDGLVSTGAVLAITLSLEEVALVPSSVSRAQNAFIGWKEADVQIE